MIDCDCVPGHRCDCWDYRNAPDAGLRADPNDLLALCDAADKDGRHTVQTSTIRAWVRAALASSPAPAGLDVERLAKALRAAEQMNTDRLGIKGPADEGPPPEWYLGYAAATAHWYAATRPAEDAGERP